MRREVIGDATLYLGDAREIVPTLPRPDALISDPPYGMGYNGIRTAAGTSGLRSAPGGSGLHDKSLRIHGDDEPFDPAPWIAAADRVVLFGAHRFHARLPEGGAWLVWNKRPGMAPAVISDAEMAWMNRRAPVRVFNYLWNGVQRAAAPPVPEDCGAIRGRPLPKAHPAQKPVAVMEWVIRQAAPPRGATILDPYMGSGSTLVAALRLGHPCVGIEIAPAHFDNARRRIEAAVREAETREPAEAAA